MVNIILAIYIVTFKIIGASLSKPHTNRYYEKNAIVMSSTCFHACVLPISAFDTPRAVSK